MKTFNTYFSNEKKLKEFLNKHHIEDSSSVLVQVFTSFNDKITIQNIVNSILILLPSAKIVGSTTDGEILNGEITTGKTVLSITLFEKTTLATHIVHREKHGHIVGRTLAHTLVKKDTKVLIVFTDGLHTNGELCLRAINRVAPHVTVSGGMAGDNGEFKETFVFTENGITNDGIVGAALSSETLKVHTDYSFNWKPIGKKLKITKSVENRVYAIDNKTSCETYSYYLGEGIAEQLPSVGVEFPLILSRNGINIARSVVGKEDDGSLIFAGNLKEGDEVQFGFGNVEAIIDSSYKILENMKSKSAETIFIYSCMARRRFMSTVLTREISPLQKVAPTAGFFTYGEFYNKGNNELLNQTMTILVLSENIRPIEVQERQPIMHFKDKDTIEALFNIMHITTNELFETNNRLMQAVEGSQDGLWSWDLKKNSFYVSSRLKEILGYHKDEFIATIHTWRRLLHPSEVREIFYQINLCKRKKIENFKDTYRMKHKNGRWIWVLAKAKIFFDDKNNPIKMSGFITDVNDLKIAQQEIEEQKDRLYHQAYHDELTELPNRLFFENRLQEAIKKAETSFERIAVLYLDLDDFKKINDSMGHQAGDEVIVQLSKLLIEGEKDNYMLSRFGGDECLILINNIDNSRQKVVDIAQNILNTVSKSFEIRGQEIFITSSIGIALYPDDGLTMETLFKNVDAAMYKAKEGGKNRYQFYKKEMTEMGYEKLVMKTNLKLAIKNSELEVYYQPQIDTVSEEIKGMEALVRWNHPTKKLIQPGSFIPLAEESGLIVELDTWVMKSAITQISKWDSEGLNPGYVSLNLTMKQLEQSDFISFLKKTLKDTKCPASLIEIEVVEGQIMTNPKKSIERLKEIRSLGIKIALDDFGTGYSSLSYIKELPISKIKIDQSFMRGVPENHSDSTLVKAIISVAKNLNYSIIAEGVETKEQRNFLLENQCDKIQGYYYSKPIPAKVMEQFLTRKSKIS